jgi:hypothetical protein
VLGVEEKPTSPSVSSVVASTLGERRPWTASPAFSRALSVFDM